MTKHRSMNLRNSILPLDRRGFLKIAGGTALGTAALSNPLTALAGHHEDIKFTVDPSWPEHALWENVKQLFVLDRRSTYMNIGTTGSMPRQVLKNYNDYNFLVASNPWDMGGEWGGWPYTDGLTARIAPQFGCASDELILSRNTTDGTLSVIHGLDLRAGDHVIATHHEHVAVTAPLGVIAERNGVDVEYVAIPVFPTDPEEYVDVIMDAVTSKTRLIVVSHIPYKTGALLPVKRICQEAAARGIVTLIDGAHASGMIDLNLHDLDCDFYAASGHKWQCGPGSTGLLYVRDNASRVADFFPKDRKPFYAVNSSLAGMGLLLNWTLQYKGNDNYPALRALADSCDLWDKIGRDRIEGRVKGLSKLTKSLIYDAFPLALVYSPDDPDMTMTSGITTFNPFADQSDLAVVKEFRDRLREEYGYIIRYTNFHEGLDDPQYTYALRISTHLFHDEDDVEGLVEAMADLYADMQSA